MKRTVRQSLQHPARHPETKNLSTDRQQTPSAIKLSSRELRRIVLSTAQNLTTMASETATASRRAYHGSCHCGNIKYAVMLTLPHLPTLDVTSDESDHIYKCNCSTCHKSSLFHVHPKTPSTDFILLSPLDPYSDLGDYRCFSGNVSLFFCRNCGVRCFSFCGQGENAQIDLDKWLRGDGDEDMEGKGKEGTATKVWRVKRGAPYFSVNAATIEPGQEGFSLKEWTEKGWIVYVDGKNRVGQNRFGEPHEGGMY